MGHASRKKAEPKLIRLDLGCGKNPRPDFEGVDLLDFGQPHTVDLGAAKWPWPDGSVEEANASHFIEHLNAQERIHFVNEAYRVLRAGGKLSFVVPHWASSRAYGDLTHQWPPVSEFWFYYLSAAWRKDNAPHNTGYKCDFEAAWGYNMNPALASRNPEYQQMALQWYKEAAMDIVGTLTKREVAK